VAIVALPSSGSLDKAQLKKAAAEQGVAAVFDLAEQELPNEDREAAVAVLALAESLRRSG